MMLTAPITVLFSLTIVHLHFIHIRGQCPSIFKKRTDAAAFGEYCQRMAFSVERVVPERYRSQMCSYKCEQSKTCVYYSYDDINILCIVCLRRALKFANPDTGSEMETHEPVPANLFARISVEFDVNACDFLDYTCASQWFGGRFGGYAKFEIQNGERIKSIQFCKDMGFRDYLGGFNITLDTGVWFIRGCMFPIWQTLFEFEENDAIAAFQVFYSEGYDYVRKTYICFSK